jgi:ribonuclease R
MELSATDILEFLQQRARHPLTAQEILEPFALSRPQRQAAMRLLKSLVEEGMLVHIKGDRYSLPQQINLVTGTVSAHRDGYGFVSPVSGEGADVFIPARFMREVMHGDRVVVRVEHGLRSGRPEGRIIRVLDRAHRTLVGRHHVTEAPTRAWGPTCSSPRPPPARSGPARWWSLASIPTLTGTAAPRGRLSRSSAIPPTRKSRS